ncbi:MAG: crotonase/enoyl-CoA hydratase family protein [Minwuia sp.]|nr:crotonase/enoyl-CoA hydratase family protein [Minwuia sp.]
MTVRTERDGPVWTVIHSRPEARNAMDPQSAEALNAAFLAFERDDTARVAVFFGEGGAFCAGWDLKHAAALQGAEPEGQALSDLDFQADGPAPGPGDDIPRGPMGPSRLELDKPVIGALAGPAVAGGMELAMWCDFRVMERSAYMGVYCRRWGIPLIDGGTVRLPRLVGQGRALELIMTGRQVMAEECSRIGLCEYVVDDGAARAKAEDLAHQIARFPQGCMRADRRSAIAHQGMSIREGLAGEWRNSIGQMSAEGLAGAGRFSSGKGRGGDFDDI